MLKNTDGKKSASFTLMIISFIIVSLWLVLSIVESIGPIKIRPFSGTDAMAYLAPILGLYWGRRAQQTSPIAAITSPPTSDQAGPAPGHTK